LKSAPVLLRAKQSVVAVELSLPGVVDVVAQRRALAREAARAPCAARASRSLVAVVNDSQACVSSDGSQEKPSRADWRSVLPIFVSARTSWIHAAAVLDLRRRTACEVFAERKANGASPSSLSKVADVHVDVAVRAVLGIRPPRDEVDRAAGGIAPEQRVLRAAQHLDALHVEQAELAGEWRDLRHLVEVQADGLLRREVKVLRADAANGEPEFTAEAVLRLRFGSSLTRSSDPRDALREDGVARDRVDARSAQSWSSVRAFCAVTTTPRASWCFVARALGRMRAGVPQSLMARD
jgi:hypothetical protein